MKRSTLITQKFGRQYLEMETKVKLTCEHCIHILSRWVCEKSWKRYFQEQQQNSCFPYKPFVENTVMVSWLPLMTRCNYGSSAQSNLRNWSNGVILGSVLSGLLQLYHEMFQPQIMFITNPIRFYNVIIDINDVRS